MTMSDHPAADPSDHWRRIATDVVFANPWWTYRRDRYLLPSGAENDYHYVHTHGSVMVIPVDAEGRLVLVRQFRYLNRRESLEFPGGGVPAGVAVEEAARRELREEAGVEAGVLQPVGSYNPYNGVTDEICTVFLARDLRPSDARPEETEDCRPEPLREEEVAARIAAGDIWDGMTLAAWTLYRHRSRGAGGL
jgi:8-oxo-dGTP pyrophosphatase MutT (NUDIX family)